MGNDNCGESSVALVCLHVYILGRYKRKLNNFMTYTHMIQFSHFGTCSSLSLSVFRFVSHKTHHSDLHTHKAEEITISNAHTSTRINSIKIQSTHPLVLMQWKATTLCCKKSIFNRLSQNYCIIRTNIYGESAVCTKFSAGSGCIIKIEHKTLH